MLKSDWSTAVNMGLIRFACFIGSNYSLFTFCCVHEYYSLGSKQKVVGIYQNLVGIYQSLVGIYQK